MPFLTIGGKVLATYTGASAPFTLGAITPTTVGGGTLTAANAGQDVQLTANATVAAGASVNSIDLNGFSLLASTNVLTVTSGGVLNSATTGTATINSPLAFGTAEGVIDTNTGATTVLSSTSAVSGSGGLTITGGGALTVSSLNTYTAHLTTLDGGTLTVTTGIPMAAAEP